MSRRVIRLSGNSTPGGQLVTSNGACGSPAEAIIRLLFGDICDRAGPFLKFEKYRHMAARKQLHGPHCRTPVPGPSSITARSHRYIQKRHVFRAVTVLKPKTAVLRRNRTTVFWRPCDGFSRISKMAQPSHKRPQSTA